MASRSCEAPVPPDELREHRPPRRRGGGPGHLRPVIGQITELERAADAHAAIEARTTLGKSLLATTHEAGPVTPTEPNTDRETLLRMLYAAFNAL